MDEQHKSFSKQQTGIFTNGRKPFAGKARDRPLNPGRDG